MKSKVPSIMAHIFFLFCLFFTAKLQATSLEPLSLEDLMKKAWIVSYGTIESIQLDSQTGRRKAIFKPLEVVHFANKHLKKIDVQQERYEISLMARHFPNKGVREYVPLAAEFHKGERVLIFLTSDDSNARKAEDFRMVGMVQGKFKILRDPEGVDRVLSYVDFAVNSGKTLNQLIEKELSEKLAPVHALKWEQFSGLELFLERLRTIAKEGNL